MAGTGLTTTPNRLGGGLCVNLVTDLANLDVSGLTLGTPCYVVQAAADFVLKVSNAAIDHSTVEGVAGVAGLRWLSTLELTVNDLMLTGQLTVSDGSTFQSDLAVNGTLTTTDVEAATGNFTGNVLTNRSMKQAAALADANAAVVVGNGAEFTLPAATLTTSRTLTLNTAGAVTNQVMRVTRLDTTANTYVVKDDAATTLLTFPVSARAAADFKYNGTHFVLDRYWVLV